MHASPPRARALLLATLLSFAVAAYGDEEQPGRSVFRLSLEQLMDAEVTSVSKKQETVLNAASAIYVITQEDIRRSGFTSIPEALRMVPGVEVARIDGNKWAISIRGFNGQFSNKLLVLIDGRTVYTPTFSGVFWDIQDTLLEDVDRIEVIRGPGATLWGANALNGVINIITKTASDTQGALVTAGGGTEEHVFTGVRYGGMLGRDASYRVYGKYFDRSPMVDNQGNRADDGWDQGRGGFRLDWQAVPRGHLTVQGDFYDGGANETALMPILTPPHQISESGSIHVKGGDILGRWTYAFSDRSDVAVQAYYDRDDRNAPEVDQTVQTGDLDLQHHFRLGSSHDVVWGLGYRAIQDEATNAAIVSLIPNRRTYQVFSAFVQDEVPLIAQRLRLTVGSKFEHNDFTGFEVQPSGRLLWTPYERHAFWLAVSRAVRTPSRVERDGMIAAAAFPTAFGPPGLLVLLGNHNFSSETVIANELGYRVEPLSYLSVDLAGFYNLYDDLRTLEPETPYPSGMPPPPHLVIPMRFENKAHGETWGIEAATTVRVIDRWRLSAAYAWLQMRLRPDSGGLDPTVPNAEDDSPKHQANLRSYIDLPGNCELDVGLYYVDSLLNEHTPGYIRFDTRVAWHPIERLEVSLVGQNLNQERHVEFGGAQGAAPSEIERSFYGKLTWHY